MDSKDDPAQYVPLFEARVRLRGLRQRVRELLAPSSKDDCDGSSTGSIGSHLEILGVVSPSRVE